MVDLFRGCMRCRRLAPLTTHGTGGYLLLCARCPVKPHSCGEYQHTFVAADSHGTHVCTWCAETMTSRAISTEKVHANAPVNPQWDD